MAHAANVQGVEDAGAAVVTSGGFGGRNVGRGDGDRVGGCGSQGWSIDGGSVGGCWVEVDAAVGKG